MAARLKDIPSEAGKPSVRVRLWPRRRHGGPYQAAPWRHETVLGQIELATNGRLTVPFKPQAIARARVMKKSKEVKGAQLVRRGEEPEDALWRNVILQAISDATMKLPNSEATYTTSFHRGMESIREKARQWVEAQSKDFRLVCELAGLEHQRVYAFAMSRIKEAIARDQARTLANLKGSTRGVGAENAEGQGDRRTQAPQKTEEIGFSQNQDSAS